LPGLIGHHKPLSFAEVLVNELDGDGAFSDRRGDPLDRR